ncbi:MAG TPA: hypothetical protein VGR45_03075, partial [Stellaceae bacterium]|nr:hypothetical protein [Stellaceae bacterium]
LGVNFNLSATMSLVGTTGVTATASARTMLQNGDYKLWTSGPVAQTIELADDTAARKYDIGFGDGYHPLRPRFYATFWPATRQIFVRVVVENGLSTEIEDAAYKATVRVGPAAPGGSGNSGGSYVVDLTGTQATYPKVHWAMTRWTRKFWIGGTPSPLVNIDNNLAYLESTRFLPNFDTAITVSPSAIATEYVNYAQNANDIYDGLWDQPTNSTSWQSAMPSTAARQEIAPYPEWTALWLYTGDWRMRQVALGLADQAASWGLHIREGNPAKRYLLTDAVGSGTGLGKEISRVDHESLFAGQPFTWGTPSDNLVKVGNAGVNDPWGADSAHMPSPFFPQYILTGDPFYLEEMSMWASTNAFSCWGASPNNQQGCGPYPSTAVYGGAVHSQLRGNGWLGRNLAETAFAEPDGTVEKTYFTALTDEMLERWEGGLLITGTAFDGKPEKVWGQKVGNDLSLSSPSAVGGLPPLLHNWESNCSPLNPGPYTCENDTTFATNAAGTYTAPWMQWYDQYAIGRATELGFAAKAVQLWLGAYPVNMITNSGTPQLVALYESPVEMPATGFTGYIAGNTLTVTALIAQNIPNPPITVGQAVSEATGNAGACDPAYASTCPVAANTVITGRGTGTGGPGTYTVNNAQNAGSAASPLTLISGGFFNSWAAVMGAFSPGFLTGTGAWASNPSALPAYFALNLASDGREVWLTPGLAMLVDQAAPNIAAAWSWWSANVYSKVPDFANDPKWAIVPRTDDNVLPPL